MSLKPITRRDLTDKLGITEKLAADRCELDPVTVWKRETEFGTIEKIALCMEEGFVNHIYLCLPRGAEPPYRAFICLQGHSTGMHTSIAVDWKDETTPLQIEGDRDFAIGCMQRGIAAVCLEQRAMGENSTDPNRYPACHQPAVTAILAGKTLVGDRVYDVDRVIDYLYDRGDFDPDHIGVMGNSGGGTTAMYAGAALPRLTHVMPSCSFCTYQASIIPIRHCICNYIPGLLDLGENADILALIAPRPLVIVNGREDDIFPLDAAQYEFTRLHARYQELGAGENCVHVIGDGGHRFYAEPAWNAMLPLWNRGQ